MNVDEIKASYRRALNEAGETVKVRRYTGIGSVRPFFEVDVIARVVGFKPDELVGTVQQGDRKVILLAEDLIEKGFALPLVKGDKVVVGGKELNMEAPDANTRRVAGVLVAYELQVRG